ncbi:hypothetical protein EDB81DRAFT_853144 [Dactylonectria macrodidyma]|uniref:NmrA-like domain-containing protein n=1 Tax=Dactylonectria macrodidyma TaxID=307937 RepID=A0A9P9FPV8_9HYPO|nr:hypothetical protein EDB81DRAFT_853144 [Dactylonectria macrodidyma]
MAIQNVAVVGASGTLGTEIVKELLDAGFNVTAITRNESKATFPDKVTVKRADLSSIDSVAEAFSGQDAIISTAASAASGAQKTLIDAAIAAKVPRFIPSEFGIETRKYRDTKIGSLVAAKVKNTDYLIELAGKHDWFTWTGLSNGLFFDWTLKRGNTFVNPKEHKYRLVDSGNEPFSASTLGFIGKAVVGILKNPAETANKYLSVAGNVLSQNDILQAVEKYTGAKFDVTHNTGAELEKIGDEKLARGDFSAFGPYLESFLFSDGSGHGLKPEDSANELLGLKQESLEETIKNALG